MIGSWFCSRTRLMVNSVSLSNLVTVDLSALTWQAAVRTPSVRAATAAHSRRARCKGSAGRRPSCGYKAALKPSSRAQRLGKALARRASARWAHHSFAVAGERLVPAFDIGHAASTRKRAFAQVAALLQLQDGGVIVRHVRADAHACRADAQAARRGERGRSGERRCWKGCDASCGRERGARGRQRAQMLQQVHHDEGGAQWSRRSLQLSVGQSSGHSRARSATKQLPAARRVPPSGSRRTRHAHLWGRADIAVWGVLRVLHASRNALSVITGDGAALRRAARAVLAGLAQRCRRALRSMHHRVRDSAQADVMRVLRLRIISCR